MNLVQITGSVKPTWDSNLVKSIILFNAYNTDSNINCKVNQDTIYINFPVNEKQLNFMLKIPFDYPNNFEYFKLLCTNEIEDDTTVTEFINKFNDYFNSEIVNISLGFILKFISDNKNIISTDLKFKENKLELENIYENANAPLPDEIEPDYLETKAINNKSKTLETVDYTKNNYYRFLNSRVVVDFDKIHLYNLKQNKLRDLNKISNIFLKEKNKLPYDILLNFELTFNELLLLNNKYNLLFFENDLFYFNISKDNITFRVKLNTLYPCAEPDILLVSPVVKEPIIKFISQHKKKCIGTHNLVKIFENCFEIIKQCTVVNEEKEYDLVLEKLILNDTEDCEIFSDIGKIGNLKEFTKDHLYGIDINVFNSNIHENRNNLSIKKFLDKFKSNNLLKYNKSFDSIEFHNFICYKIETLKMHPYTKNKEYFNKLINYVISNEDYFKELNLNNIKIQYTSWCKLNQPKITLFEKLLSLQ